MAGLHHLRINAACLGLWFRVWLHWQLGSTFSLAMKPAALVLLWLHQPLHSAGKLSMSA